MTAGVFDQLQAQCASSVSTSSSIANVPACAYEHMLIAVLLHGMTHTRDLCALPMSCSPCSAHVPHTCNQQVDIVSNEE